MGGSGGGSNNDFSYWQNIQQDKDNAAAARAQDAQAAADQKAAVAENTYQANLGSARADAQNTAQRYFSDRGIPFDQGLANSIIGRVNVPDLDPNPASYFDPKVFASGIADAETAQRQKYSNQVDAAFAPGFERAMLPDSSIDPIVNSILSDQQRNAQTILDYNQRRGLLNDTGYGAAQTALNQQASAGRSTLQDLATSVLGKERQGLTDIRGEAGTLASGYNYGAPAPDFSPYSTRASTLASTDLSNLEGSIRGALGTTNLFDVPTALAKGGTVQGPQNITTAGGPPPAPLADRTKMASRGLGTTGVF